MGVIASTLTTAIFFTSLIYYCIFGEKLSISDWIGAILIMVGVSLIGLFSGKKSTNTEEIIDASYTTTAILVGLFTALSISLRGATDRYFINKVGFTSLQYNLDAYLIMSICFIIALTAQFVQACQFPYTYGAVLWATLFSVFSVVGTCSLTAAFSSPGSKGGAIQSIDSIKVMVPLILDLAIYKVIPTYMQLMGIFCTIVGALVISCMKSS